MLKQRDIRDWRQQRWNSWYRAGYSLLDHIWNENIFELEVDSVVKKLTQYKQKWKIMPAWWKTLDTQNTSLTIILLVDKDLEDH